MPFIIKKGRALLARLLQFERDYFSFRLSGLVIVDRYFLIRPITREFICSNDDQVCGVLGLQLPGFIS